MIGTLALRVYPSNYDCSYEDRHQSTSIYSIFPNFKTTSQPNQDHKNNLRTIMPPELQTTSIEDDEVASLESFQSVDFENDKMHVETRPISPPVSRNIHFSPTVEVRVTLHVNDYTDSERHATWYTCVDLKEIQDERLETIQAIINQNFVEDDDHSARGLETPEEKQQREENTLLAIDCVLEEQDLQNQEGIDDPDYIALLYQYCCLCSHCTKIAHERALSDYAQITRSQDGSDDLSMLSSSIHSNSTAFDPDSDNLSKECLSPTQTRKIILPE